MRPGRHLEVLRAGRLAPVIAATVLGLGLGFVGVRAQPVAEDAAHFDALLTRLVAENEIPGLAAVLVRPDEVVLRAGYGTAELGSPRAVDPDRTVFPLGSVSKVLTTIAVLQLADRGTVDLDADIARYLGTGAVDRRFDAPVTLRHLLTHTDGFDVRWIFGGAARVPEQVQPLERLLARLPPRVLPPGEIYLYGDVGMTIAGRIVERVTGQPFAARLDQTVFAPLGMSRASFRPDRPNYARERATGYDYDETGQLRPMAIVYPHATPASGLTATVGDLAPLLQALLRADSDGGTILSAQSRAALLQRQFTHHPAIAGTSFGFYEYVHRGRRAFVHGGLLPGYTSVMILLPEAGIGFAAAANRFGLIEPLEHELTRALLDHYAPADSAAPVLAAAPDDAPDPRAAAALAGRYRCDQYSRLSADKLLVLAGLATDIEVTAEPDGSLHFAPEDVRWRALGPRLYEREDTGDRVTFEVDAAGRGTRILGSAQFMTYHRIGPADDVRLHAWIGAACLALACVGGPTAAWTFRRRLRGSGGLLAALAGAAALGWILFAGAGLASVSGLDFATAAFGEPPAFAWLRWIPLGCAALAALQLGLVVAGWRRRLIAPAAATAYAGAALATLLLLPLLAQWQLVRLPAPAFDLLAQCLSLLAS